MHNSEIEKLQFFKGFDSFWLLKNNWVCVGGGVPHLKKNAVLGNHPTLHGGGVCRGRVYGCGCWHGWQVTCYFFVFFLKIFLYVSIIREHQNFVEDLKKIRGALLMTKKSKKKWNNLQTLQKKSKNLNYNIWE